MWVTSFTPKALTLVDPADFSVVRKLPMDLAVLHGLARDGEGIWCADRGDKLIVKYHAETGEEMEAHHLSRSLPGTPTACRFGAAFSGTLTPISPIPPGAFQR